jgi:hypothetical protein
MWALAIDLTINQTYPHAIVVKFCTDFIIAEKKIAFA